MPSALSTPVSTTCEGRVARTIAYPDAAGIVDPLVGQFAPGGPRGGPLDCWRSSWSDSILSSHPRTALTGRSQTMLTNQTRWLRLNMVSSYV